MTTTPRWRFRPDTLVLELDGGRYEVDLERCRDCAEVLDWIVQVALKGIDFDLAGLVVALDEVFRLQANFCPCGRDESPNALVHRKLLADAVKRLS